ncbi:MAG: HD domain-containing protein [Bacteroidetes bacterium]|nr:HD domain-containing protein [Bacteroidota bacterium]
MLQNKRKLINDPIYGFITIPSDLVFEIIEHIHFQRLRRIKQLGLTELVYPGAIHTRFHHALGAMHLMKTTLDTLRSKGNFIYDSEYEAALIAILLHDIGHGPFSHTLEKTLLKKVTHEQLSILIMERLNHDFDGKLDFALQVFKNEYPRKFLNQLVSSQLDIDRLDYLRRDSFFTGVQEGTIGSERIIKMLNIVDDELVVEEKGIYSIENFLSARRLMYWQGYLHKTTVCAEKMLIKVIERARYLLKNEQLHCSNNSIKYLLTKDFGFEDFTKDNTLLDVYCSLDDTDILGSMKEWAQQGDIVLKRLCEGLINRQLFQIRFLSEPVHKDKISALIDKIGLALGLAKNDASFCVAAGSVSNAAYIATGHIKILQRSGQVIDVAEAADLPNIRAMKKIVKKHYVCWPKEVHFDIS